MKYKRFIFTAVIALSVSLFIPSFSVLAADTTSTGNSVQNGVNAARGDGQPTELLGDNGILSTVSNTLLFVVGALSVIMIIWGGLRYAISGGNSSSVTAAKNTIMYAIVGLIVAFLAFAAVNWVLGTLTTGQSGYSNL